MKVKAKTILKSLAELPAETLALAVSVPGKAVQLSKQVLLPPARATRRQIRAARWHTVGIFRDIQARAHAPLRDVIPWPRGGLNE